MSPRRGGEASKLGDGYESVWTTRRIIDVLAGRAQWIRVEDFGDLGHGAEFTFAREEAALQAHQLKRQLGRRNGWTLLALKNEGVLQAAAVHASDGREFHFISEVPARDLDELSEKARHADDLNAFIHGQLDGKDIRGRFDQLSAVWGSAQTAWETLRGCFVVWPDERELRATNAVLAELLLQGASGLAITASIADLVEQALGVTLTADELERRLAHYEIERRTGLPQLADRVGVVTNQWLAGGETELLTPAIPRPESNDIVARLQGEARLVVLAGAAGVGKSAVLLDVVKGLRPEWPVLAFRLDRREAFQSTEQLGAQLDLPVSPVAALAAAAGESPCLLVIDQLDALSRVSGRMSGAFEAVAELVREARAFPDMRVLVACRRFDLDNDAGLRGLTSQAAGFEVVELGDLDAEQVATTVAAMGIDPAQLSIAQRALLTTPLNLVLLSGIADEDAIEFSKTTDLLGRFWERKRRDCDEQAGRPVRFTAVIDCLVDEMSARQRLSVPAAVLDAEDLGADADVLRSAHVLAPFTSPVAFFHEAFFDYAFARRWAREDRTLVEFLLAGEQELFRRAQVRQVLTYLRDEDPPRFLAEVDGLLREGGIRFHIKDVVLALLRAQSAPTREEASLMLELIDSAPAFTERVYAAIQTPGWFRRLDDDGHVDGWLLGGDPVRVAQGFQLMRAAAETDPSRVARLLEANIGRPGADARFAWLATWLPFAAERRLFDLLLGSMHAGVWDGNDRQLWMVAHVLGDEHADWGVELVDAWLQRHGGPDADSARALRGRAEGVGELARAGATKAPAEFLTRLLPYMQRVMLTAEVNSDELPVSDRHFSSRGWDSDRYHLDETLVFCAAAALQRLAESDLTSAMPYLQMLAVDSHDAAQWLLYSGLAAAGAACAGWAGEILAEGEHRLYSGYNEDGFWTTRELLLVVGRDLASSEFEAVEGLILGLRAPWERAARPLGQFTLLSALPAERLSPGARRRLGELRRLFGVDQPAEPVGFIGGFFEAPVSPEVAAKLSDGDWMGVIEKHSEDVEDWSTFTGGSDEQATVLEREAENDPERFARFGLQLDATHNPAYLGAILRALGKTSKPFEPTLVFDLFRHAAAMSMAQLDDWLGFSLQKAVEADVPDDIIGAVLDRAMHAAEPIAESWLEETSLGPMYGGDPFHAGMNSARGQSALILGDLVATDADGHRTALITPSLGQLAGDPIMAVRACVAHVLSASIRHARGAVVAVMPTFLACDDRLLASHPGERLIAVLSFSEPELSEQVVRRMLVSSHENVREAAGRLGAFIGLQDAPALLDEVVGSTDAFTRRGAALICAHRAPYSGAAADALVGLFDDEHDEVRKAAAAVAAQLRGKDLSGFTELLQQLIASPAFEEASAQLVLTLQQTRSPTTALALALAERFIEANGPEMASIASAAAADTQEITELVLRAYADSRDVIDLRKCLDLIDRLLMAGAWGVDGVVGQAER